MTAIISPCGNFRYLLTRPSTLEHPEAGTALFVMLNPSTADAILDDPTIRKCRGFAQRWGCAGITVANLYAYRATDPRDLKRAGYPVGPENDSLLRRLASEYSDIVCAWGNHANPERALSVCDTLSVKGARLWCLGTNRNGTPRHPLMVSYSQPLIRFREIQQNPEAGHGAVD